MLAIGRALMAKPKLILLDEPSLGLAPLLVAEIFEKIKRINQEYKMTILLVEQNARLALGIADHAYIMESGASSSKALPMICAATRMCASFILASRLAESASPIVM